MTKGGFMKDFDLRKEYVIEYYDFTFHTWRVLYKTFSRKLAIHQLNKCKECFHSIKYRLYELERIM